MLKLRLSANCHHTTWTRYRPVSRSLSSHGHKGVQSDSRQCGSHCCIKRSNTQLRGRGGPIAAVSEGKEVYKGVYGPWSVEPEDEREVWGYRAGLSVTAVAWLLCTIIALSSADSPDLQSLGVQLLNPLWAMGAAGFGVSLVWIHIYVDTLKKTLQAFCAMGVLGAAYLALSQDEPVPLYVIHHPWAVWLVGPFFAAMTGLGFKEGVCYGKPEAAVLFFLLPLSLLGHLSGIVPSGVSETLFLGALVSFLVLAARKYTQAVKDDIGDKSVFMFRQLPPEQQAAVIAQLESSSRGGDAA